MLLKELDQYRRLKRVTIQDLGKLTGLSRNTISAALKDGDPKYKTVQAICGALGLQITFSLDS